VGLDTPVRRAISFVPIPSAASSTIRARCASPARIDGDRTHEASTSRSRGGTSTFTVNGINHRPPAITRGQGSSLTGHYLALGVTVDGERDVRGLWAGEHGDREGAKYWLRVRTETRNRG